MNTKPACFKENCTTYCQGYQGFCLPKGNSGDSEIQQELKLREKLDISFWTVKGDTSKARDRRLSTTSTRWKRQVFGQIWYKYQDQAHHPLPISNLPIKELFTDPPCGAAWTQIIMQGIQTKLFFLFWYEIFIFVKKHISTGLTPP